MLKGGKEREVAEKLSDFQKLVVVPVLERDAEFQL